ncbi:hypothetical protein IAT38_000430 [Cryptococcus sp. DSM 104549]
MHSLKAGLASGPSPTGSGRNSGDSRVHTPGGGGGAGGSGQTGSKPQTDKEIAEAEAKRRKVQRACDVCRRKKIKCDGPMNSLSDSKCAHCQEYAMECTYVEAAKRRGPPKGYLETLEQRCGRLERMLQQFHPTVDLNDYVGPPPDRDDFDLAAYRETLASHNIPPYPALKPISFIEHRSPHPASTSNSSGDPSPAAGAPSPGTQVLGPAPWRVYDRDPSRAPEDEEEVEDEAAIQLSIANTMSQLNVRDAHWRYHGKASGAHLMRTFNDLKYHNSGVMNPGFVEGMNKAKRQQYWQVPEWELVIANEGLRPLDYSSWPDKGLDQDLIDAYFDHINLHLPLLNRKFFQRQYDSGMWRTNAPFSRVCLMIFANGARFVDDSRVYWPAELSLTEEGRERLAADQDGTLRYSAGWRYLRTLLRMGRSIMQGPNLYEFQTQVLVCQFLQGSAVPHLMWILSGFGLRSAQELGIHVRATLLHADPIERALYSRAFWCLYHIDRINCAAIGRSVAIQDTDFDADYPIDVDDEFWDTGDPALNFKQPEEKGISRIAAFIQTLKLDHIIGATLRTIYAINKLPEHRADLNAQRAVVVELDSALNSWADNVPDELRWDPTRSDYTIFQQSAVLYVYYYYCQILIHRPFIPTPRNQNGADLPSLAICANAARSICNITDASLRRGRQQGALPGRALNVEFMLPSWIAAIILLINIYSGKQTVAEREKALGDIRRCLAASKELELTWRQSGKYTDFLVELADEAGMPRTGGVHHGEKRSYDDSDPPEASGSGSGSGGGSGSGRSIFDPQPPGQGISTPESGGAGPSRRTVSTPTSGGHAWLAGKGQRNASTTALHSQRDESSSAFTEGASLFSMPTMPSPPGMQDGGVSAHGVQMGHPHGHGHGGLAGHAGIAGLGGQSNTPGTSTPSGSGLPNRTNASSPMFGLYSYPSPPRYPEENLGMSLGNLGLSGQPGGGNVFQTPPPQDGQASMGPPFVPMPPNQNDLPPQVPSQSQSQPQPHPHSHTQPDNLPPLSTPLGNLPNPAAEASLYNSLMGMSTFESQLMDMSATAFGAPPQDMGGENDWWAQLFTDYT